MLPGDSVGYRDLRPLEKSDRKWGAWTYGFFWLAAAANLSNWFSPSSFMKVGLTLWESLICHLVGQFLAGVCMVFSGRPGAVYHIGYPVVSRASFGMTGAIWPILNRVLPSIIWNAINVVQGGQCIYVMLHAIFPTISRIHNVLDHQDAINSGGLICFFVFWIFVFLGSLIPIPQLRYVIHLKVILFLVSAVAMLAWTLKLSGGIGSERVSNIEKGNHFDNRKAWLITKFIFLSWGNNSTFIANASDFQRYCSRPNQVILGQIIGFPIGNFVIGLVGLIVASTSTIVFGEMIWNPITYLDKLLDSHYTPGYRAGCFFIALFFAISGLFSCIFENLLPVGNDLAGINPRYLSVRRGIMIGNLLAPVCIPWRLLGTATNFISWLSAYQTFLACIIGIILVDYFVICKGQMDVERDLFVCNSSSIYWFKWGFNWRAFVAYILGVGANFYGFLGVFKVKITPAAGRYFYFAFPAGIVYSGGLYFIFTWLWPTNVTKAYAKKDCKSQKSLYQDTNTDSDEKGKSNVII